MAPDRTRVALITGGACRIGRAIALRLANAGFDIAFTFNTSENSAATLGEEIAALGRSALHVKADLLDLPASVDTIERAVRTEFGRLDVLVNNASLYQPADLPRSDLALSRRLMTIHVEAPLLLCQRFAGELRKSRGHVINMIDLLAERPWPKYMAYCASKAALANLTLSLARELAPEVTVNGISPGVVEWPADLPDSEKENYLKRVPLGHAGMATDVAEMVHFLCTAGTYVTGQILRVDGGRSIT